MAKKTLTIPANLNINALLEFHPPKTNTVSADDLAVICSSIFCLQSAYEGNRKNPKGFVNLHSVIMQSQYRHYTTCLGYLQEVGVIESDHHYIPGEKSKGFRFTEQYFGMGFKDYKLTVKRALNRMNRHERLKQAQQYASAGVKAPHLFQWFNTGELKINANRASYWINERNNLELRKSSLGVNAEDFKSINHKHDLYRLSVRGFSNNDYNCKVDETAGRFHSRLTNTKGELRCFLDYNGKPLTSLDIKNSQPYLSLCLFDKSFYASGDSGSKISLNNLYPEVSEFFSRFKLEENLLITLERAIKSSGFAEYRKLVLGGDFYERVMELVASKRGQLLTREHAKEMVYTVFFGDPNKIWANTGPLALFKEYFPEVAALFNILKSRQYQDLAILLQRIESFMVIQSITKEFNKKFPDACLFTIHDSVLTTSEFVNDLEEEINSQFRAVIGNPPRISKVELKDKAVFDAIRIEAANLQRHIPNKNWTPVMGFEGLYEINPNAEFRSLYVRHKGALLKTRIDRGGYVTVRLSKGGKESTFWVHRLLAEHFIPNPNNFSEVNHLNGCKLDNSLNNLAWISHQGNTQHAVDIGFSSSGRRRRVKDVCKGLTFASQRHASSVYGIPYPTLKNYLSGRRPNPTCLRLVE
jgi:hypothetical protein